MLLVQFGSPASFLTLKLAETDGQPKLKGYIEGSLET